MKVHVAREVEESLFDAMVEALDDGVTVTHGGQPPAETEVLVIGFPDTELLASLTKLTTVVIPFAGVVPSARAALSEFPRVTVYNLHHNAAATAEKAIELLLAVAKNTVPHDRAMRVGDWSPRFEASEAVQLEGRTALVVGYGEIGKRVARACKGLGMDVIAVKRNLARNTGDVPVHEFTSLPDLWPKANVVIVCAPLTQETENLIDATALAAMAPDTLIVNVGRGKIIDEEALFLALKSRSVSGAGLDVWWEYPREGEMCEPSKFPYRELDNVVMSPHIGGSVQDTEPRRLAALVDLINRIQRKDDGLVPVDLAKGY